MFLYDTARNSIVPFEPGEEVSIYVCGITPYDSTHLGHANTYLTYDLLIRRLEELGHTVKLVRNITDVDDSILGKARELGVDFLELAAAETARFHGDMAALNTRPVSAEPHARVWVPEMIELITTLEKGDHTYTVEGATFFDVTTFDTFGAVSGYDEATMIELAAERGGHPDDPPPTQPPRLRAVATVAARRTRMALTLGTGPSGMAHRMQAPCRWVCSAPPSTFTAAEVI